VDANSLALFGDALYINNVKTVLGGDLTNWPQGNWFAMEIDLGAKLVWFKNITIGGFWNNNPSANPATGIGGASFSALTTGPWFLATQISQYQDGIVLNVGEFPYLLTPSSGFGTWNFLLKRDLDPASNDNDPMWLEKAA
jgi:hypothetical protein